MRLETVYLRTDSPFTKHIREWASSNGLNVENYEVKGDDEIADGLLVINENQDLRKDIHEIHDAFDKRHIPTQKIDINGTLQVAVNSFRMWLENNKCKSVLVMGGDELVKNENLDRFLNSISGQARPMSSAS